MEKVSKGVEVTVIHGKWYSRLEYMALRTKTWLCEAVRDAATVQVSNWTLNEWDPQEQCKVGGAGKGETGPGIEVRCRPGPKHHDLEDSQHAGSWRKPAGKGRGYHAEIKAGDMPLGAMVNHE